jgi:glucan-binding YG repeat protein
MRASRDQNSTITCPVLKEKEKRRKDQERQIRQKQPKNSANLMPAIQSPKLKNKNVFAELEMEDDEGEKTQNMKRSYGKANIMEFPELPSICPAPVKESVSTPEKKSYACIATPIAKLPENIYTTPVQEIREPVAPSAPLKIMPFVRSTKTIGTIRRSWADDYSSDEEDDAEIEPVSLNKRESWIYGGTQQPIPVGHSSDW